jgi:UMF1 family MFS transporter
MMRWVRRSSSRSSVLEDGGETASGRPQRPAGYVGEDTSPTTKRELLGWYTYAFGAEVYAVCGTGKVSSLCLLF